MCPEVDILQFCSEKKALPSERKRKKNQMSSTSFWVLISGAQNADHKTNPVFRSTLTESKVPISDTPHPPGSPVQCVCIDVANCVGFSLDAQLYFVTKNCFSDVNSLQVKRL